MQKWGKGFTLIELLVAIGILAILMAGMISLIGKGPQQSARDGRRQADLQTIASALELYRHDNRSYPKCSSGNNCNPTNVTALTSGGYLTSVPTDVTSGRNYVYAPSPSGCDPTGTRCTSFVLCTALEKNTTADIRCSGLSCGATCSLAVTNP